MSKMRPQNGETKRTARAWLRRILAVSALTFFYGFALLTAKLFGHARAKSARIPRKILVVGTFHNPNWFLAHITPIVQTEIATVFLVADGYVAPMENVQHIMPATWACRLFTRAGAKFIWAVGSAFRFKPDLYMGYAIFPGATISLVLGRLFRRPACFQLTSGQLELAGGGYAAENRILSALGWPSMWIERLAAALTRQFELMIVRGGQAEQYVRELGHTGAIEVVTGSVDMPDQVSDLSDRPIDIVFVGRLTERKRPEDFVAVVNGVCEQLPNVRALIVGDGPDRNSIEAEIEKRGLEHNIELAGVRSDVLSLLDQSKLFVLTSRWEGLSIAMMEAMAAGCVPICSHVGDLEDILKHDHNGYLNRIGDVSAFVDRALLLLSDDEKWTLFSTRARSAAVDTVSRQAVTARWREVLLKHTG